MSNLQYNINKKCKTATNINSLSSVDPTSRIYGNKTMTEQILTLRKVYMFYFFMHHPIQSATFR